MDNVINKQITCNAAGTAAKTKQTFWQRAAVLVQDILARDPVRMNKKKLDHSYSRYKKAHKPNIKLVHTIISLYNNAPVENQASFRNRLADDISNAQTNVRVLLNLAYRIGDATDWKGQNFDKKMISALLNVVKQYHPNDLVSAVNAREAVKALWENNYHFKEFMKTLLGHDDAEIVRFAVFRISASGSNFNLLDDHIQSIIRKSHDDAYLARFITNHFDRFQPDSRLAIFEAFSQDGFPPLAFPLLSKMLSYEDIRSRTLDILLIGVKSDKEGSDALLRKELTCVVHNIMDRIDTAGESERARMLGVFQKYFFLIDNLLEDEDKFLPFGMKLAKGKDFINMFAGYDIIKRLLQKGSVKAQAAISDLEDHLHTVSLLGVNDAERAYASEVLSAMRQDGVIA